jgi:pSer/pThr/pTyr-binding forkhead associated (FHA) protein
LERTAAVLVVRSGALAGTRFEVDSELLLGREDVDVTLDDPELSRRHAAIRTGPNGVEVEDLDSLNGTWVNESRVEGRVLLRAGDVIRVGTTELEVELPRASAPTVVSAGPPVAAPEPKAAPPSEAAPAPVQPFGVFAADAPPRRIQTRALGPTVLSYLTIVATAVALVVYFAVRS